MRVFSPFEFRQHLLEQAHRRVQPARIGRPDLLAAIGLQHLVIAAEGEQRGLHDRRHHGVEGVAFVMRRYQRGVVEEVGCLGHFDISSMSSSTISRIFSVFSRASSASPRDDRVEQFAVIRKGAAREILAVERVVPEALEGFAHLRQQLPEQRIVGGIVDRQVEGEILGARRAGGEVNALHLDELLLDHARGLLPCAGARRPCLPRLRCRGAPPASAAGRRAARPCRATAAYGWCRPISACADRCRCPCASR